jgi:hypothetical protein
MKKVKVFVFVGLFNGYLSHVAYNQEKFLNV